MAAGSTVAASNTSFSAADSGMKGQISDTFSIQIDHNYINGVSPVLDIVKENEDASKDEECKDSDSDFAFDDVTSCTETTIIGQSEINKLAQTTAANGVMKIPQTIIRLRTAKDFHRDFQEKVESSLPLSLFPIPSFKE